MAKVILLSIVFVIMMFAPLVLSWVYYLRTDGVILHISQDKSRDQRYFAKSFSSMIENALHSVVGNTIMLSKEEKFVGMDDIRDSYDIEIDNLTIIRDEDFLTAGGIEVFHKEIYAAKNAFFSRRDLTIRAAYSKQNMVIGNKTNVIRWVDGEETLAVYDDCDLGMSATAGKVLSIGKNVKFRRLYAPVIYFGQYPGEFIDPMEGRDPMVFKLPILRDKKKIKHITHENLTEYGTANYSVVTSTRTMMVEDAILQGDIHADVNVRICSGAGVLGNIFAEKNILLEKGSFVMGNVFAQGKIEIEDGVMIGLEGRSISVICRDKLTIGKNVVIYGYVSSETEGWVSRLYDVEAPRFDGKYSFIEYKKKEVNVSFKNMHEYLDTDALAYRMNPDVVSADIPIGADSVKQSMFCGCSSLKKAEIPSTVEEIGNYAFYECKELRDSLDLNKTKLHTIGVSSFEGCKSITKMHFPSTMRKFGAACCSGMEGMTELIIDECDDTVVIEDHAFRGCKGLTDVRLPDKVISVGVSAFRDCDGLKTLSVPASVKEEPGISELPEILPELEVTFR